MYNSLEELSVDELETSKAVSEELTTQNSDDDDPGLAAAHDSSSASTLAESPLEHATSNKATIAKKSIKILRIATFFAP
jgi:hypothetical protein